ncbi:MAG: HPr-rel-A system PqqD family peptide chaperone [Propionivibrio sp.]|nr:HPr-rel-A system PqqD family peptide chaperone [Propionivibrio sp.]
MDRFSYNPVCEYAVNPVCRMHWVCWGGECVVFDETSGQTHCMDSLHALVLDMLVEGNWHFSALLEKFTAIPDFAQDQSLSFSLQTILKELQSIGLVDATA